MNTTPAGNEPNRPGGPLAPTAPGKPTIKLTTPQKWLVALALLGGIAIAGIGFVGSYTAVTALARSKGFGSFSRVFTLGIDIGIGVFLAIDLLLTWLRMPYPVLRYGAWLLTAATIVFNASVLWPDPLGAAMHGVIPLLFIVAVEAARHAVGRIAQIVADKHLEGPPASRWFLNPISTFTLWRRQRLWAIRKWDTVLTLERERRVYIGQLRGEYGRAWRRKATADKLLILRLATKDGLSITEALELPEKEAEKQRATKARIDNEQREAANRRRREEEDHRREQQRLDEEAAAKAEADRIANERQALALQQEKREAARVQELADAEHQARLDEIARQQRETAAEEERRRQQQQIDHARDVAAEQERAAKAAQQIRENQEAAANAAREKEAASRRAAEIVQRAASANGPRPATSQAASPASASRTPASPAATSYQPEAASPASATATSASPASANAATTSPQSASASANQTTATSAADGANYPNLQKVVDVYNLLKEKEGKAPSDASLGNALGVSRSRAQQLRTAAIDAGHTELAKPFRIAS